MRFVLLSKSIRACDKACKCVPSGVGASAYMSKRSIVKRGESVTWLMICEAQPLIVTDVPSSSIPRANHTTTATVPFVRRHRRLLLNAACAIIVRLLIERFLYTTMNNSCLRLMFKKINNWWGAPVLSSRDKVASSLQDRSAGGATCDKSRSKTPTRFMGPYHH
jgi:hypothetical protein